TGLYCLAHPDQFPVDGSKIIFMLTNLSGDAAKIWAQPLNQRVLNKSDPDVTPPTLAKFITSFNSYFLAPERKGPSKPSAPSSNPTTWSPTPSSSMSMPTIPLGATIPCHTFKISPPTHSTTATNPNAMDLLAMNGILSDSECVKMMQAGQCF
ncbi:uncharacterized protein VP01_6908g1, partial [Puccinia sorghi]